MSFYRMLRAKNFFRTLRKRTDFVLAEIVDGKLIKADITKPEENLRNFCFQPRLTAMGK